MMESGVPPCVIYEAECIAGVLINTGGGKDGYG